ncbi:MAG: hypothetical protein SVZ03_06325 [Spirochaetota bacterium]|nr:hypothetical protein [Spirochaetota bacterium]
MLSNCNIIIVRFPHITYYIVLTILIIFWSNIELSSKEKITLVYTNSLNGNFDYCHCKENPKGGLVKRATELRNIRNTFENVFLFETGDIFPCDPDHIIAKYLIKGYKCLEYDSIIFGDQEFLIGIEKFIKFKKELPFICNNILFKTEEGWISNFTRFLIIKRNNIAMGIIGSISKNAFRYHPKEIVSRIKILDQIKEIKRDIDDIQKQGINLIILLSHSGYDEDLQLLKKIKGVDVTIGGHSQTLIKNPERIGDSILVQAGANGAHIGILELIVDEGKILSFKNSFRLPDEFQPEDDKHIRKLINEYKKEIKKEYNRIRFD